MTIQEMLDWFDTIQDKSDSPYFTEAEKVQFINRAQTKFVNEYLEANYVSRQMGQGSAKDISAVEANIIGIEVLEPLIVEDVPAASNSSGIITHTTIKNAMNSITSDSTDFISILSVSKTVGSDELPVRFVRQNDYYHFKNNTFKKGTATDPTYRFSRSQVKFDPDGVANYKFSLIKEPVDVAVGPDVNCELPEFVHDRILAIALDDAGVASRDAALIQLQNVADQNIRPIQ